MLRQVVGAPQQPRRQAPEAQAEQLCHAFQVAGGGHHARATRGGRRRVGRPAMLATRLRASVCASATANCAVGGARGRCCASGAAGRGTMAGDSTACWHQRAVADGPDPLCPGTDRSGRRPMRPRCSASRAVRPADSAACRWCRSRSTVEHFAAGELTPSASTRLAPRLQAHVDAALRAARRAAAWRRATPAARAAGGRRPAAASRAARRRETRG